MLSLSLTLSLTAHRPLPGLTVALATLAPKLLAPLAPSANGLALILMQVRLNCCMYGCVWIYVILMQVCVCIAV